MFLHRLPVRFRHTDTLPAFLRHRQGRHLAPLFVFSHAEEGEGGEGEGDASGDAGKKDPPADVVPKAEYDELKSSFSALSDEIKKIKTARAKDTDADRLKKGEHEKVIAEKTAALEALEQEMERLKKSVETYQGRDSKKASGLLEGLPDDVQARLKPFQSKLDPSDWLSLLEAEADMHKTTDAGDEGDMGDSKTTPPPTGSATGKGKKDGRELSKAAQEILGDMMLDEEGTMTAKLTNKKPAKENVSNFASAFTMPVKDFFGNMNKAKSEEMSMANANKRLG